MSGCARRWLPTMGLALLAWALGPSRAAAQSVWARVVDDEQRAALAGAEALLLAVDSSVVARTTTDANGFFTLSAPGPGEYLVRVVSPGFQIVTRPVSLGDGLKTLPAFVLRVTAIPLDTLEAEVDRAEETPRSVDARRGRAAHLLTGERLAVMERNGVSFGSAVRDLGGVRVRPVGGSWCIESSRGGAGGPACGRMVAIVINGIDTGMTPRDALRFVRGLRVADWESMEYLPPAEAGIRYGLNASARGALVLWGRGTGPHRSGRRGGGG